MAQQELFVIRRTKSAAIVEALAPGVAIRSERPATTAVHYAVAVTPKGNVTAWTPDRAKALEVAAGDAGRVLAFYAGEGSFNAGKVEAIPAASAVTPQTGEVLKVTGFLPPEPGPGRPSGAVERAERLARENDALRAEVSALKKEAADRKGPQPPPAEEARAQAEARLEPPQPPPESPAAAPVPGVATAAASQPEEEAQQQQQQQEKAEEAAGDEKDHHPHPHHQQQKKDRKKGWL